MHSMELSTSVVEYKVHGNFCSRTDGRNFPDTFFFSARELKDAGLPKARIREAIIAHHSTLLERGMGDLDEVSSDEEEPEEEEPAAMQQDGTDLWSLVVLLLYRCQLLSKMLSLKMRLCE